MRLHRLASLALAALSMQAPNAAAQIVAVARDVQTVAVMRDVHVTLHDTESGEPIRSAPVTCSHTSSIGVTDQNGQASFVVSLDPSGETVLFHAAPRGHAPIFAREHIDSDDEHVAMCAPPSGRYLSPLLTAGVGGTYSIQGSVAGAPVLMEVDVAPLTMPFDGYLDVTPYPGWATKWKESDDPEDYRLAYFHVGIRDSQGRVQPDAILDEPITVRLRPWILEPTGSASLVSDAQYFAPRAYDAATGSMLPTPADVTFLPSTDSVEWRLATTGIHGIGVSFPSTLEGLWLGDTTPDHAGAVGILWWLFADDVVSFASSPPASVNALVKLDAGWRCDLHGTAPFICGATTATTEGKLSVGSNWSISSSIVTAIQAEYSVKAEGAAKLLAEAELGIGVSFEASVEGVVGGTTTREINWGCPAETKVGHNCCSGNYAAFRVDRKWTLMIGSATIGSVTVPQSSAAASEGDLDPACHHQVGDQWVDCGEMGVELNCDTNSRPLECSGG